MGSIAAVRSGYDIAAHAGRPAGTPMTQGAAIREARAQCEVGIDVADPITFVRSLPFHVRELALIKLPPSSDRTERVMADHAHRRARGVHITASRPDLICQRLVDSRP